MSRFLDNLRMNLPGRSAKDAAARSMPQENDSKAPAEPAWGPLDLTNDGIVLLNEDGVITDANALALELLQCTLSSVSGRDFWDAVPEEIAEQHQSAAEQALRESARYSFVGHQRFENSWIEYTFRRHASGYVVNLRDFSATQSLQRLLADSERYNQIIFEANPNAMWVFDLDSLRILAVNQAAVRFYGIPRKVFMTLGMAALFPDGEGAALLSSLNLEKAGKEVLPELRLCKQKKMDGQQVLVELAWSQISWNEQQAVVVSLADISQRHLADSALRRTNGALEQALARQQSELKTVRHDLVAFTHAVSSDLQDSMHVAQGFAARLADKYSAVLDESGRHYVSRIQASLRQLAKLVDDLRTLAQLSQRSGTPVLFDLVPVCHSLQVDLLKRDPDRVVTLEIEDSLPLMGDRRLLETALACLLENAWKFTAKKTEAWIKVGVLPGNVSGELILRVSDNGAGFDAAYSGKLFTAFQRLHSSADFSGNGLGLAIVKRVADLHGGRVWAESNEQAGASFFMALPQGVASAPQDSAGNLS